MRAHHVFWLLLLSQCAAADVFILQLNDTNPGRIINTTGTWCNGEVSCILDPPQLGLNYLDINLRTVPQEYLFAEPGDDNTVGGIQFWPNAAPRGAVTEIYLPGGYPTLFYDFTAVGGCSSIPWCSAGTQNGTEYYLGNITYEDGETNSFYFQWFVSGLPVAAPEPGSLVLLATACLIISVRRSR